MIFSCLKVKRALEPVKLKPKITIADHFAVIQDPRIDRTLRHKLIDIITIAVCAVICGADGWVAIETYGCAKYEWLKTFLELPNGIPSHDTAVASTGGNPRTALPHLCKSICTNKSPIVPVMFS